MSRPVANMPGRQVFGGDSVVKPLDLLAELKSCLAGG
jgi:hypothetical protein